MLDHVRDDELMDAAEGTAAPVVREHVQACSACRDRVAEVSAGFDLARAADVPEPPPLYWDAFRRQVGRRVGAERLSRPAVWVPALAVAAVLALAIGWFGPGGAPEAPSATLPAWSASLPTDVVAPLEALETVAPDDLAWAGCRGLADCLSGLSDEEATALADLLSRELAAPSDL